MNELKKADVLATITTVALLFVVVSCQVHRTRSIAQESRCINNLRGLMGGAQGFALDHGHFVTQISTNLGGTKEYVDQPQNAYMHFRVLVSSYLTTSSTNTPIKELVCPLDNRLPAPL